MKIEDTSILMKSKDYKERFIAEYHQLNERAKKLEAMLEKYKAGKLDFTPSCPISIMELQLEYMFKYLSILEARVIIENVDLFEYDLPF